MPNLKLAKLPDRTPVKLTISVMPELAERLADYAVVYQEAYARGEAVVDLIPFMLDAFVSNDRGFIKARERRGKGGGSSEPSSATEA